MLIVNEALAFFLLYNQKTYWHRYCVHICFTVNPASWGYRTRNVSQHFLSLSIRWIHISDWEWGISSIRNVFLLAHASIHPCKYCVFCLRTRDMPHSSKSMCVYIIFFCVPFMSIRLNTLQLNSSILNRLTQHLFGCAPWFSCVCVCGMRVKN